MDELKTILRVVIANNFVMYFKAHSYHFNVEGSTFPMLHDFFGDIYEDLHGAFDSSSEELRALNEYAASSISELYNYKTIVEDSAKPATSTDMLNNLLTANDKIIESLNKLFTTATAANEQGLANYAADRLDKHKKTGWMLRSTAKKLGE